MNSDPSLFAKTKENHHELWSEFKLYWSLMRTKTYILGPTLEAKSVAKLNLTHHARFNTLFDPF
jgi:hypothetical protein